MALPLVSLLEAFAAVALTGVVELAAVAFVVSFVGVGAGGVVEF